MCPAEKTTKKMRYKRKPITDPIYISIRRIKEYAFKSIRMIGSRVTKPSVESSPSEQRFKFQNVVVGSTLQALRYAFQREFHIVFLPPPFTLPVALVDGEHGRDILLERNQRALLLSLYGKLIRVDTAHMDSEAKILRCASEGKLQTVIEYDRIFIFDDEQVSGLPSPVEVRDADKYQVFDLLVPFFRNSQRKFSLKGVQRHRQFPSTLMSEVFFLPKTLFENEVYSNYWGRLDAFYEQVLNEQRACILTVSYLDKEQIALPDFSEATVRLSVARFIERHFEGREDYSSMIKKGRLEFIHIERKVMSLQKNFYKNTREMKFFLRKAIRHEKKPDHPDFFRAPGERMHIYKDLFDEI